MSYESGFENARHSIKVFSQGGFKKFAVLTVKENGLQYFKAEFVIDNLRTIDPFINFGPEVMANYLKPEKWEKRLNPQTVLDIQNVSSGIVYDNIIVNFFSRNDEDLRGTYLPMHLFMDFTNWAYCYYFGDSQEDDSEEDDSC